MAAHADGQGEDVQEDRVLSDLHVACRVSVDAVCTTFSWVDLTDEDGDLVPRRRARDAAHDGRAAEADSHQLTVWHTAEATPLGLVGLQVWRGALVLCDYLWAMRGALLQDKLVVELGAGCGLVALVAAAGGADVLLTDAPQPVLENALRSLGAARDDVRARVRVRRLDWSEPLPRAQHRARAEARTASARVGARKGARVGESESASAFEWSATDVDDLRVAELVLCADCVYDPSLTEHLLVTVRALLGAPALASRGGGRHARALLSLERRLNFSLPALCESDGSAYARFRELLLPAEAGVLGADGSAWQRAGAVLVGEQIDLARVPCSMRMAAIGSPRRSALLGEDRATSGALELWELRIING
ncbi:hypothetical protein KFE25_010505 [Diacronema lutheri]|uniref:Calmodulin-lysine N-methyltransferase n=1 Tax=Diacronema lutheri TaxID=2081491 RepID=A0A8J6CBB8_DIALT|nr:hypothetical protein KFE25_010505 [Diacronema lutheri]